MPLRLARKIKNTRTSHYAQRLGLAAALILVGGESLQNAVAEGDTRTISLHHLHTGEDLTITYKRNGRYDDESLKKLNHVLRDWRRNEEVAMDPRLIDLVWEVQRDLGSKDAVQIVCGYRAPATNAMLRRRSSGVARFSQHTLGKAMDFYIPGVPLDELRAAGLRLQRGGVGFYPTSGSPFVHLDVGSVRHWPRMTHDQLVRVFPNGRTVHVPSDGHPLPGYALALADIEKRGGTASTVALETSRDGVSSGDKRGLLAKLFGFGKTKDEEDDAEVTASTPAQIASAQPAQVARAKPVQTEILKPAPAPVVTAAVPMPRHRPAPVQTAAVQIAPVRVAGATPVAMPAHHTGNGYALASAPAKNVFDDRGYWKGAPEPAPAVAKTASLELSAARRQSDDAAPEAGGIRSVAWPVTSETPDRSRGEIALAYAAHDDAPSITRKDRPMGAAMPATTIARKGTAEHPALIQTASAASALALTAPARNANDPWLRAAFLTPSVKNFMTISVLGAPDYRTLRPLLQRPSAAVVMTFSQDPHLGMSSTAFGGDAVIFLATATFSRHTAALQ